MIAAAPAVSVCMSVFNGERFLASAVESVLTQSLADLEFVVIDDGSTDGSRGILESFAARDPRIRLTSRENRGMAASLNEAIAKARSPYVARMDGDDLSRPERLERQVAFLDANPEVVATGCQVLWIDPEGWPLRVKEHPLEHEEIDGLLVRGNGWAMQHPAVTMRADVVREVGGYRDEFRYSEDLDLFLRLGERGRLANLPETLYEYRQHGASVCRANRPEVKRDHDRILEEAWKRRGARPEDVNPFSGTSPGGAARHRVWGWWALEGGHLKTARKHAFQTLLRAPLSPSSWRLACCAIRGR